MKAKRIYDICGVCKGPKPRNSSHKCTKCAHEYSKSIKDEYKMKGVRQEELIYEGKTIRVIERSNKNINLEELTGFIKTISKKKVLSLVEMLKLLDYYLNITHKPTEYDPYKADHQINLIYSKVYSWIKKEILKMDVNSKPNFILKRAVLQDLLKQYKDDKIIRDYCLLELLKMKKDARKNEV